MQTYEDKLNRDVRWALREGSMHFERESAVFKTLHGIAAKLDDIGVPYAVVGGMAMFLHGFRRFTEDVDVVVTAEGLRTIHQRLEGLGYVKPQGSSKHLRDVDSGVRIKFLITGLFPGDGKPKPVSFPDPSEASIVIDGVRCVRLNRLIEMKLASGSTTDRLKDLSDVQELIRTLALPVEFSEQIDPSVRPLFIDIWNRTQRVPKDE